MQKAYKVFIFISLYEPLWKAHKQATENKGFIDFFQYEGAINTDPS